MDAKYLTASRNNLLDSISQRYLLGLDIIQSNSLENFMLHYGQKLSYTKYLFVDLFGLVDNNNEIVRDLETLKILHDNMKIIVIADKDDDFRGNLIELLRRIVTKGIYNIVTNLADEEFDHCMLVGKTEIEAIEAFAPKPKSEQEEDSNNNGQSTIFDLFNDTEQNTLAITSKDTKPLIPIIIPKKIQQEAPLSQSQNVIRANKEFRKFKEYISVGICGTQSHIGTTHNALQIAVFLKEIGFRVCYVETHQNSQSNGQIYSIKEYHPKITINESKSMIQYSGLNLFYTGFEMAKVMADKYDFYVFDLGVLSKNNINQFLMRDVKIIVSGTKSWELKYLKETMILMGVGNLAYYLLNFSQKAEQSSLLNYLGVANTDSFFIEYQLNPFKSVITGANIETYKKIFKEYILQEQKPQPQAHKKKRGFFG